MQIREFCLISTALAVPQPGFEQRSGNLSLLLFFPVFLLTRLKQMHLSRRFSAFDSEAVADGRGSDRDIPD